MPRRRAPGKYNLNEVWGLVLVFIVVLLLWNTILIAPLKILVVFFHELSHAVAALLSGGRVHGIEVNALEGGLTLTSGGNPLFITSAGYVGSMLWGALLILSARFVKERRRVTYALGMLVLLTGLVYVRPILSFGLLFCLLVGGVLLYLARRLHNDWQDFILKLIGITNCLYAVLDIKSDVLERSHLPSDAVAMQQLTMVPSVIWGLIWIAMSLVFTWWCLRLATRRQPGEG